MAKKTNVVGGDTAAAEILLLFNNHASKHSKNGSLIVIDITEQWYADMSDLILLILRIESEQLPVALVQK